MVGHVERGVIHADALRRHAFFIPHLRDLLCGALLNGDLRAGRERHIDRGARRADIKRDAVMLRQYRHGGGADLVRGVAVPCHTIAADKYYVNFPRLHQARRGVIAKERRIQSGSVHLERRESRALQ